MGLARIPELVGRPRQRRRHRQSQKLTFWQGNYIWSFQAGFGLHESSQDFETSFLRSFHTNLARVVVWPGGNFQSSQNMPRFQKYRGHISGNTFQKWFPGPWLGRDAICPGSQNPNLVGIQYFQVSRNPTWCGPNVFRFPGHHFDRDSMFPGSQDPTCKDSQYFQAPRT